MRLAFKRSAPCFQTQNLRWFLSLFISLFLSTRHNLAYINPLFGYAHPPARACPPTTTCLLPRSCACSLFIRVHLCLTCTHTQKLFNAHTLAHERNHVEFFREGWHSVHNTAGFCIIFEGQIVRSLWPGSCL